MVVMLVVIVVIGYVVVWWFWVVSEGDLKLLDFNSFGYS